MWSAPLPDKVAVAQVLPSRRGNVETDVYVAAACLECDDRSVSHCRGARLERWVKRTMAVDGEYLLVRATKKCAYAGK